MKWLINLVRRKRIRFQKNNTLAEIEKNLESAAHDLSDSTDNLKAAIQERDTRREEAMHELITLEKQFKSKRV